MESKSYRFQDIFLPLVLFALIMVYAMSKNAPVQAANDKTPTYSSSDQKMSEKDGVSVE